MSEIKLPEAEWIGELRAPAHEIQRLRAELRDMVRRGEIAYAFNLRQEPGGIVAVSYVRLRDPRPRAPRYVAAFCAVTGVLAGLGGMVYHARHVIAALAGVILAGLGLVALLWLLAAIIRAVSSSGHCPGAWHR